MKRQIRYFHEKKAQQREWKKENKIIKRSRGEVGPRSEEGGGSSSSIAMECKNPGKLNMRDGSRVDGENLGKDPRTKKSKEPGCCPAFNWK